MQKETFEPLLKERSSRASLTAGFRLYTGNFRRIFKATWLVALIASLISGVGATVSIVWWPELIAKMFSDLPHAYMYADQYFTLLIILCAFILLSVLDTAIFGGYAAALLKQHQEGGAILPQQYHLHWEGSMVWQSIKTWFWCGLISLLLCGAVSAFVYWKREMLFDPMHNIVSVVAVIVMTIIVCVVMVPLAYPAVKYLMNEKTSFWPLLVKRFGTSMRYWGRQFVVLLVCAILLGLLYIIASLPEIIICQANSEARFGVIGGDPLGMPSYITALTCVTCTLGSFMQLYIALPALFCLYYMYGSIDTREDNKNKSIKE
ncbi:MAG: hypothetical protein IJ527_00180 [Prevotella sp.]|nr:hypothetical protein [Prevotella sp.]